MFFPEHLYLLAPRDQQVTWLDTLLRTVTQTAAVAAISSQFVVPPGRAMVLTHAHVIATPGAAQNIVTMELGLVPSSQAVITAYLKTDGTAKAANAIAQLDWQGELVVPPGWVLSGLINFNAAVAANSVTLSFGGILIPIGNIQQV